MYTRLGLLTFLLSLLARTGEATPYILQYGGRLVKTNGHPVQGPISVTANFYHQASGGALIASQNFASVTLSDGVFSLPITLTAAEFHTVFSGSDVWVEVVDNNSGTIYPRQRFTAVPYAFKVPVDGVTLDYNSSGQLNLKGLAGADLPAGTPANGQILKWNSGAGWEWGSDNTGGSPGSVDSATIQDGSIANADIAAGAAIAGTKISPNFGAQNITTSGVISGDGSGLTNLPSGPLGTSIDSSEITDGTIVDADISGTASIAMSKINGLTTALSNKEPTITAGTASQYLRGDKSWATLDTSAIPENTNLYFTDARARAAISGSGPISYNSGTGVFSMVAATSFANGYLSSGDWIAFNAKQPAIASNSTVNTGTLTTAQQNAVELKAFGTNTGETGELRFNDATDGTTNYVGFKAPDAISANKIWTLPATDGSNGQCLVTNGSGVLSWSPMSAGSVTSITAGTGLSGGTISSSGTISLANTAVTAGAYTRANITVDAQGRLTSAANGGNVNLSSEVTGTLPVGNGGTGATSLTSKGILFGAGSSAISATAAGSQYNVLTAGAGGTPAFGQVALGQAAAVSGQLAVGNGGTGLSSGTSGGVPYFSSGTTMASSAALTSNGVVLGGGAGAAPGSTAAGAAYQALRVPSGGGAPAFGALDISQSAAVTGVLPVANGGTNSSTTLNNNRIMVSNSGAIKEAAALTNGQLLIGATVGAPVAATLSQGANSGVTITNGAGSITLDTAQDIRTTATPTFAGVSLGSGSLKSANQVLGTGDATATPAGGSLQGASGAGANIAGTDLSIKAGNGTGTGGSGSILFQTAPGAASSSTANTMATRMTIDKNGNVGIGTSSPAVALDVAGKISLFDGAKTLNGGIATEANATVINFGMNDDSFSRFGGTYSSASQGGLFRVDTRNIYPLYQFWGRQAGSTGAMSSLMSITAAGNVGIGTDSPSGKLAISDGTNANTLTFFPGSIYNGSTQVTQNNATWLDLPGSGTVSFSDSIIVNGGNVGIGTTAPTGPLSIAGSNGTSSTSFASFGSTQWRMQQTAGDDGAAGTLDYRGWDSSSLNIVGAGTPGSNRNVRIFDSLTIGIGATNTKLQVHDGSIAATYQHVKGTYIMPYDDRSYWRTGIGFNLDFDTSTQNYYTKTDGNSNGASGILMDFPGDMHFYAIPSTGNSMQTISPGSIANYARMTLLTNGNVGIGTTNPGYGISINSPGAVLQTAGWNSVYRNGEVGYQLYNNGGVAEWSIRQPASGVSNDLRISTVASGNIYDKMTITTQGNVGIGTTSPSNTLQVVGSLCVKSTNAACAGSTAGRIYASNTTVASADVAEFMPVEDETLKPGDVVSIEPSRSADQGLFAKSKTKNQANAIGVVSTSPGISLGSEAASTKPIALAGRVPVNVTLEGGPIAVGDFLVTSSTPGKAMRAKGPHDPGIIGIALSAYNGAAVAARDLGDGIAYESGHQVMMLVQNGAGSQTAVAQLHERASQAEGEVKELKRAMQDVSEKLKSMQAEAERTRNENDEMRKFFCANFSNAPGCKKVR